MPVVAQDVVHVEPVCSPIDYCDRDDYLAGDRDDYLAEREPTFNPFAENAAIKNPPGGALGSDRGPVGPARAKFDLAPVVNPAPEGVALNAASSGGLPDEEGYTVVNRASPASETDRVRQRPLGGQVVIDLLYEKHSASSARIVASDDVAMAEDSRVVDPGPAKPASKQSAHASLADVFRCDRSFKFLGDYFASEAQFGSEQAHRRIVNPGSAQSDGVATFRSHGWLPHYDASPKRKMYIYSYVYMDIYIYI